jgi:hypothetical protein
MLSHELLSLQIFLIPKKHSTHMPVLLRIIHLPCLALYLMVLLSMKLVRYTVRLLGRFNSNTTTTNNNSSNSNNRSRKVVFPLPCCFLTLLPINNITLKTISSKLYPHHLFIVTPITKTLHHHPNLQVLPSHVQEVPYSYANLSDALNRIAIRVTNKLMG